MTTDQDPRDDQDRAIFWEALGNALRPYAGWIFYGFGALFVLIGYFGISDEAIVAKQLPYLISGGIGGILLAILGAYFMGIEELRRDSGRLDRIERQIEELHRALLDRPDAPVVDDPTEVLARLGPAGANGSHRTGDGADEGTGDHVLVVEAGESFHRAGCALATGKQVTQLRLEAATEQGLHPCPVCEPVVTA